MDAAEQCGWLYGLALIFAPLGETMIDELKQLLLIKRLFYSALFVSSIELNPWLIWSQWLHDFSSFLMAILR